MPDRWVGHIGHTCYSRFVDHDKTLTATMLQRRLQLRTDAVLAGLLENVAPESPPMPPKTPPTSPAKPSTIRVGQVGVYVMRGPREDGRWYWSATAPTAEGKRRTVWSGWGTPLEAESAVAKAWGAADAEAKSIVRADPTALTVAALLESFAADCATRAYLSATTTTARNAHGKNLVRLLGGYALSKVGHTHTRGYLNARMAEGIADRSAWAELTTLRTAWRWGLGAKLHGEPWPGMPPHRLTPHEPGARPDTVDTAWDVADWIAANCEPWTAAAYLLAKVTGCRTAEGWHVRVGDIDLDDGTIRFPAGKTGARTVAIDADACAALAQYVAGRKPEERYAGTVTLASYHTCLNRAITRACAALGVARYTAYGLRRQAVDAAYHAGVSPTVAGAQTGQTPEVAQRIYLVVPLADQKDAAEKIGLGRRPNRYLTILPLRQRT